MTTFLKKLLLLLLPLLGLNIYFYAITYQAFYKDYNINKNATQPPQQFSAFLLSDSHGDALKAHTEEAGIYNFS